jgi:DNA-cytosine methyltransferase
MTIHKHNILSLFDGISCARVALEKAGIKLDKYYASEIDKYAIQVALKNYPDTIQIGSVVGLDTKQFSDIDLLIGGSPCQDLSIAKKDRQGLSGQRSGLFFEYVRILKEVKPKYFILENVNSMPKEAKEQISEILGVEPVMINASLISAQNRKRLFWVGELVNDKYEQVVIPQPEDRSILLKDILEKEVDSKYYISARTIESLNSWNNAQAGRVRGIEGKSVTLQAGGGGTGAKTGLYHIPHGYATERISVEDKYPTLHTQTPSSNHLLILPVALRNRGDGKQPEYNKTDKANSLTTVQTDSMVQVETIIRKLTPIECERLQSLPDNYTERLSNTQRYKCLGNAFNADVVAHILTFLLTRD